MTLLWACRAEVVDEEREDWEARYFELEGEREVPAHGLWHCTTMIAAQ